MSWLQCHQQSLRSQYACLVIHLSKYLFIQCVLMHWACFTFVCNVILNEWRNGFFGAESHNYNYFIIIMNGSIVSTVTGMWAAPAGVRSIPGWKKEFSLLQIHRSHLGPTQAPVQWTTARLPAE